MSSAEITAVVDVQPSIDITTKESKAEANVSSNNKRKRFDSGTNSQNDTASNNSHHGNNGSNHKRRKKKKGSGGGGNGKASRQQHNKKRNWIENCSESYKRIPSNCAAPVICVISRSEIEEEQLLPKQHNDVIESDKDTKHTLDKEDFGAAGSNMPIEGDVSFIEQSTENSIASFSKPFANTLSKEAKQPWDMATTITINGEQKKLFIPVRRHASANGPTNWQQKQNKQGNKNQRQHYVHLPDGDNGDGQKNPYSKEAVPDKFWAQRKRLFSRYDEGIQIGGETDPEMWYSVTPESIANHIANRMLLMINENTQSHDSKNETVIIDAFCGCGGNSIAFARTNDKNELTGNNTRVKVIAVDNNLSRLKMAANNASIYGINKTDIVFVHADVVEVLSTYEEGQRKTTPLETQITSEFHGFAVGGVELLPDHLDALFLSPPWGGMDYNVGNKTGETGFDPVKGIALQSKMHEKEAGVIATNGGELITLAAKAALAESKKEGLIAVFLPRNICGISFTRVAVTSGTEGSIELEQNVVNGKLKTVTAYMGPCVSKALVAEGR